MTPPRKPRHDRGSIRITDRDIAVTLWIGEQISVRSDQLALLLGINQRSVSDWGARMRQYGWIHSQIFGFHNWMWLTARGLKAVNLPYRTRRPSVAGLQHLYSVNQVRLWFAENNRDARWTSERALRRTIPPNSQARHMPDGALYLHQARHAIEVELIPKDAERTRAIIDALLASGYSSVDYFCNASTMGLLHRVRDRMRDQYHETEINHILRIHALAQIDADLAALATTASAARRQQRFGTSRTPTP